MTFKSIIGALSVALTLQRADPQDKATIASQESEIAKLKADLEEAKAETPTQEEAAEIDRLLNEFAAAQVVVPDAPAPSHPYPGENGDPVTLPETAEGDAPAADQQDQEQQA